MNLIMVLGFMVCLFNPASSRYSNWSQAHGYATNEFEVTEERLGVYLPTEHIDNPKGYGEGEDPRQYDPRLRGPVDVWKYSPWSVGASFLTLNPSPESSKSTPGLA